MYIHLYTYIAVCFARSLAIHFSESRNPSISRSRQGAGGPCGPADVAAEAVPGGQTIRHLRPRPGPLSSDYGTCQTVKATLDFRTVKARWISGIKRVNPFKPFTFFSRAVPRGRMRNHLRPRTDHLEGGTSYCRFDIVLTYTGISLIKNSTSWDPSVGRCLQPNGGPQGECCFV